MAIFGLQAISIKFVPPLNSAVNITLDCASLFLLFIILYSSIVQKSGEKSRRMFIYWNFNLIALITCELFLEAVCVFLTLSADKTVLTVIHRILFVLDFMLYNLLPVTYYRYISSFITMTERQKKGLRRGLHLEIMNVFILTAVFASSLYTGWFYTIDANTFEHYTRSYLFLEFFVILNWHLLALPFRLYTKQYGRKKKLILLKYIWVPLIALPVDLIFNMTVSYALYAFATLYIYVQLDIQQTRERAVLEAKIAQTEKKMNEMQVELMLSQIHPHFLYNTLSVIACLCRQDPIEAEAATNEFSDYLKANLSSINSNRPIPFARELLHSESYLKIQKRRFPENLQVFYEIKTEDFHIPALALQTMVENAVKYAVESRYEMTTIRISSFETAEDYRITVEDDGPGFDPDAPLPQDRPHLGISSTRARLKEMSGGSLEIRSVPGKGTLVTIIIPRTV